MDEQERNEKMAAQLDSIVAKITQYVEDNEGALLIQVASKDVPHILDGRTFMAGNGDNVHGEQGIMFAEVFDHQKEGERAEMLFVMYTSLERVCVFESLKPDLDLTDAGINELLLMVYNVLFDREDPSMTMIKIPAASLVTPTQTTVH